jgi:hypothetical protein
MATPTYTTVEITPVVIGFLPTNNAITIAIRRSTYPQKAIIVWGATVLNIGFKTLSSMGLLMDSIYINGLEMKY